MGPTGGDDSPLPLRELARRAGVSDGTLRNWAGRSDRPLRVQRTGARSVTSTVSALRAFCAQNPDLPAARTALARLDNPASGVDTQAVREVLAVVVAAVRATTAAHLDLARTGVGVADNAAAASREHAATLSSLLRELDRTQARIGPPSDPG